MMLDLAEISGLADPAGHVRRCTESALVYLELITMAICGIVPIMVVLAYTGLQRHDCASHHSIAECEERERRKREASIYVALAWILPECLV
jgi:hypothetical protein